MKRLIEEEIIHRTDLYDKYIWVTIIGALLLGFSIGFLTGFLLPK